jgi:cell division protein FtsW (lipid II flippase)
MYAFADGGIFGRGLNLGVPLKVPVVESDMIFAAIGEELGLLGAAAVLVAFVLMIGAGLRIAQQTANGFERLLATGLTTLIGFQAFIILAGVTRLLPLTGVTLPFVSYGGSSLLANWILLALLLRIANDGAEREAERMAAAQLTQIGAR